MCVCVCVCVGGCNNGRDNRARRRILRAIAEASHKLLIMWAEVVAAADVGEFRVSRRDGVAVVLSEDLLVSTGISHRAM